MLNPTSKIAFKYVECIKSKHLRDKNTENLRRHTKTPALK